MLRRAWRRATCLHCWSDVLTSVRRWPMAYVYNKEEYECVYCGAHKCFPAYFRPLRYAFAD